MPDTRQLLEQIHKLKARKPYNFFSILLALEKAVPQYFIPNSPDYLTEKQLYSAIRQGGWIELLHTEKHLTDWILFKHYIYKP